MEVLLGSAQRRSVTCRKSHSKLRTEFTLEFRPQDAQSKACCSLYQVLPTQGDGGRVWGEIGEWPRMVGRQEASRGQGQVPLTRVGKRQWALEPRCWVPEGWPR